MYKVTDFYIIKEDDLFEGHYDVTLGPKWGEILMARDSAEFFANIIYIFGKYQFHFTEKLSNEMITRFLLDEAPEHMRDMIYNVLFPNLIITLSLTDRAYLLNDIRIDTISDPDSFYDALYAIVAHHIEIYTMQEYYTLMDYNTIALNTTTEDSHMIHYTLNYSKLLFDVLKPYIKNSPLINKIGFRKTPITVLSNGYLSNGYTLEKLDNHAVNIAWKVQEVLKRESAKVGMPPFVKVKINGKLYNWDLYDDNIFNNIIYIYLIEGGNYELL